MGKKNALPINTARTRLVEEERRREERIKLAIAKGKQTMLPTQTKRIKLSKFEHRSDEGPLVVFAQELAYPFGYFGKYHAVRKYQYDYDIGKDYSKKPKLKTRLAKKKATKRNLMLNDKPQNTLNGVSVNEQTNLENNESNYDLSQTAFRLPKLKSGQATVEVEDNSARLEFSMKNTELPKLPAQDYIDNFRRDAAEFERSMIGIGRGNVERRLLKGRQREASLLPRIDERGSLQLTTNTDKLLTKDEHFRLPKLQQKRDDSSLESQSKRKRKTRNNSETKKNDSKRSMSHSERKAAAQREQAKWCKMTFQSNAYT